MKTDTIFHSWLDEVDQYVPGRPPGSKGQSLLGVSRLASNENPLGPSPHAVRAYQEAVSELNRYPDDTAWALRDALAAHHAVDMDCVVVGNGSNDIIDQCVRITVGRGLHVVMSSGSFPTCRISSVAIGATLRLVPLREATHDLEAMAGAITPETRLAYVCNPNNPTGTMNTAEEVRRFIERVPDHVLMVFDEAYYEYVQRDDYPDLIPYVRQGRPVVVLRTFSKVHSLASLRIGYGICPPEVASRLQKVRLPFNVNGVSQAVALAALRDREHVEKSVRFAGERRKVLAGALTGLGLEVVPSVTNFLMVRIPVPSATLLPWLLESGIHIRPLASFQLPDDHYRITVGKGDEDEKLVEALKRILGR